MTAKNYQQMLNEQKHTCAICNGLQLHGGPLHIDHDHKTKKVRGLLCNRCNTGLGQFEDNTERLKNAIEYLRKTEVN